MASHLRSQSHPPVRLVPGGQPLCGSCRCCKQGLDDYDDSIDHRSLSDDRARPVSAQPPEAAPMTMEATEPEVREPAEVPAALRPGVQPTPSS